MELMDASLDHLYTFAYHKLDQFIAENVLAYIIFVHERIDPIEIIGDDYDERSDVWSLGLTIYELSTGYYPFEGRTIPFDNMKQIVFGPSLELTLDRLSDHCKNFLNTCLNKDRNQRSKYEQLLKHPFLQQESESQQMESIFAYFPDTIDRLQQNMNESK
ncbi:unnamed protein product [Rotaria socialis]|uniref:mitogen-activated protein kinase kinase n=1 Tax=Rotaria socialis TaxID=392032 RepID=A0A818D3Q6_9BILA|nr:unnamed protein product [Rotaria socialis]CAF3429554.1 unnamed protein product [Rotaria socialis]CAF3440738.1 unnamed protein product [Rotaria socialis]